MSSAAQWQSPKFEPWALTGGLATAGGANTLTDGTKNWTVNLYTGMYVFIIGGTGAGQYQLIASNTATALTTAANWNVNPDATSSYTVVSLLPTSLTPSGIPTNNVAAADYTMYLVGTKVYAIPAPDTSLPTIAPSIDAGVVLNAVFTALGTAGGKIHVRKGVYNFQTMAQNTLLFTGLVIEGEGDSSRSGSPITSATVFQVATGSSLQSILKVGPQAYTALCIRDIAFSDNNQALTAVLNAVGGTATTCNGTSNAGQNILTVNSTAGYLPGQSVIINQGGEAKRQGLSPLSKLGRL